MMAAQLMVTTNTQPDAIWTYRAAERLISSELEYLEQDLIRKFE
jgi:hypothetical protein